MAARRGAYVLRTWATFDSSSSSNAPTITLDSDGNIVARGVLDPGGSGGDEDFFKINLSAGTEVVIHTTDSIGDPRLSLLGTNGTTELAHNTGSSLWPGFFDRPTLVRRSITTTGDYFIRIKSEITNVEDNGFYTVHVTTVTNPGNTIATATPLRFGEARGGSIASNSDVDHFRLVVSETTDIEVRSQGDAITGALLDADGNTVTTSAKSGSLFVANELDAGTYYIKITPASGTVSGGYTLLALTDPSYYRFLALCGGITTSASITDPLYGCQWHLNNTGQLKGGRVRGRTSMSKRSGPRAPWGPGSMWP